MPQAGIAGACSPSISDTTVQRFVLAEYIKASQVDTDQLVAFIKMYNLQADWFSMQLPGGEFPLQRGLLGLSGNRSIDVRIFQAEICISACALHRACWI